MAQTAKYIKFIGSVQGVGFRYTAHRIATRCELTGFVRNLFDGNVEMFAQGHPDDIDECIADIKESFSGYIRKVEIEDATLDPQYTEFMIKM